MVAQHGFQVDPLALERDLLLGRLAGVLDRERDGRALVAFEFLDGLVDRQPVGRFTVDLQDAIAGQHARPVRRRVVHRADDLELAIVAAI